MNREDVKLLVGIGLGALGIGIAIHDVTQTQKVDKALRKFGTSLNDITDRTEVEISDSLIHQTLQAAANAEAKRVVATASEAIAADIRKDMSTQVGTAVTSMFYSVKDDVKELMRKKIGELSPVEIERAKRDIIEEAKKALVDKIEHDLDEAIDDAKETIQEKADDLIEDADDRLEKLFDSYDVQLKDAKGIYSRVHRALGDA